MIILQYNIDFLLSLFCSGSRVTAEIAPELREKRALKQSKMNIRVIINWLYKENKVPRV